MLNGRNLIVDTLAEQYDLFRDRITDEFWDFSAHEPIPNSIYVLGRQQTLENLTKFKAMAEDPNYVMVFGNSAEGSGTLFDQLQVLGLIDLVLQKKVLIISGGDMHHEYAYLLHDHFLIRILEYPENIEAMGRMHQIFHRAEKPYDFLFLNGRVRPHRKYLWERLRMEGLINKSLWTMLDGRKAGSKQYRLLENGRDIMDTNTPIRSLGPKYEVNRYRHVQLDDSNQNQYAKFSLFGTEWGEIYLELAPYMDTYFSLVTETVMDPPQSFRTEKIAKVLAVGHPWICASNHGFYRDLKKLGFKTFGHLIDESFDQITDSQERLDRIVEVTKDLCKQGPRSFMLAAEDVCKYNQQHLVELVPTLKASFLPRFESFIKTHRP